MPQDSIEELRKEIEKLDDQILSLGCQKSAAIAEN